MNITNIKLHTEVQASHLPAYKKSLTQHRWQCSKKSHSFVVFRFNPYVFTCFYTGFINVTGIRKLEHIDYCLKLFCKALNIDQESIAPFVIDNISSQWPKAHPLPKLKLLEVNERALVHARVISTSYNRERFPALFLKTKYGTVLWFATPSIVGVGSKSLTATIQLKLIVDQVIQSLKGEK